jgi:hypothetical protein
MSPIFAAKSKTPLRRLVDILLQGIELMGRYQIDCPGSDYYVPPAVMPPSDDVGPEASCRSWSALRSGR